MVGKRERQEGGGGIPSLQTFFRATFSDEHFLPSQTNLVNSVERIAAFEAALAGSG